LVRRGWGEGSIGRRTVVRNGKSYTYWRVSVSCGSTPDGRRIRKDLQARTEKAARAKLAAALRGGTEHHQDRTPRLADYAAAWLEGQRSLVSAGQFGQYQANVRHHYADLEHLPLTQITPQHVRDLIAQRQAEEYAPRTIHGIVGTLRLILGQAETDGLVARNVAKLVKLPKLVQKEPQHFTAAETRRFLDVCATDPLGSFYAVAIGTGLRRSELLALVWPSVDLRAGLVHVRRSKSVAGVRTVPLPDFAARILGGLPKRPGPIWPVRPERVTRHFQELCERAGVPVLTLHSTRHTFASMMLDADVDPLTIQSLLGHSRPQMSAWYARAGEERRRDAMERLGKVVGG